jgi:hypothetical protein
MQNDPPAVGIDHLNAPVIEGLRQEPSADRKEQRVQLRIRNVAWILQQLPGHARHTAADEQDLPCLGPLRHGVMHRFLDLLGVVGGEDWQAVLDEIGLAITACHHELAVRRIAAEQNRLACVEETGRADVRPVNEGDQHQIASRGHARSHHELPPLRPSQQSNEGKVQETDRRQQGKAIEHPRQTSPLQAASS